MAQPLSERYRLLADIHFTAKSLKQHTFQNGTTRPTVPLRANQIPELHLDSDRVVKEITASLQEMKVPTHVIDVVLSKALEPIADRKASLKQTFASMCQNLPTTSQTELLPKLYALRKTFQGTFAKSLDVIKASTLASAAKWMEAQQPRVQDTKKVFNAEYVPLFEKYFEYNAYPSPCDRMKLAEKSMMSPRQIEVWFQNRRRRYKEAGKSLARPSPDQLPVQLNLESLAQSMPLFIRSPTTNRFPTPPPEQTPVPITCAPPAPAMPWRIEHFTILDSTDAPPHAFPTTFADSSKLAVDSFPCKQGAFIFPAPVWAPKSIPRPHTQTRSITDLCSAFNTLRIYGPASPSSPSPEPWYASRCTGPLAAPHPSLVRPQPTPSPSTPARSRRSPTPQTKSKKKRRPSTQDSRRLPSTLPSKSLSRMSSSSSLSSSSDIETPESSPAQSRAMSLPFVYGVDDHTYMHGSPPPLVFDMYAKHPPQNQHLQLPLWSIPHSLST